VVDSGARVGEGAGIAAGDEVGGEAGKVAAPGGGAVLIGNDAESGGLAGRGLLLRLVPGGVEDGEEFSGDGDQCEF